LEAAVRSPAVDWNLAHGSFTGGGKGAMSFDGSTHPLTRRRFLGATAATLLAGSLLSACSSAQAPSASTPAASNAQPKAAPAGGGARGALKILTVSHFVPAYDTWLDQWATDWGGKNNAAVEIDHILSTELVAKIASEVAAGGGHDLYRLSRNGEPALYHDHMVDVSDLAKQIGDVHGGWISLGETVGLNQGSWRAVPEYFIDFPALYRKDIFDANGLAPIDTWDDLLKAGAILKAKGTPIGIAINQKSNDANNSWTGVLWSFGASVVASDGKTVTLNSPETRQMLTYAVDLYNKAMTNEVLSWDDTGNNLLLASGKGSWIQNPISALRTMEKETPDLADKIYVSNTPAGPKGRMTSVGVNSWAIANYSSSVSTAKAFLTDYYAVLPDAVRASQGYNQPLLKDYRKKPMAFLGEEPKLNVLQDFDQVARSVGYPGPPNAAAGEVESNWIIPLMVGRAVQDGNIDNAVEWATQRVEQIYSKYT
jgi:multiple sugar transport system substrate-binding protein